MVKVDKIIDATEIRKKANSDYNSITGYCNWFNNLVKYKRNNLSKKKKKEIILLMNYMNKVPIDLDGNLNIGLLLS